MLNCAYRKTRLSTIPNITPADPIRLRDPFDQPDYLVEHDGKECKLG
jgi:hypothetical protein